jgi:hypothetical protein
MFTEGLRACGEARTAMKPTGGAPGSLEPVPVAAAADLRPFRKISAVSPLRADLACPVFCKGVWRTWIWNAELWLEGEGKSLVLTSFGVALTRFSPCMG